MGGKVKRELNGDVQAGAHTVSSLKEA